MDPLVPALQQPVLLTVHVGTGVFIPRPETEAVLEWAVAQPLSAQPVIVDLVAALPEVNVGLPAHGHPFNDVPSNSWIRFPPPPPGPSGAPKSTAGLSRANPIDAVST